MSNLAQPPVRVRAARVAAAPPAAAAAGRVVVVVVELDRDAVEERAERRAVLFRLARHRPRVDELARRHDDDDERAADEAGETTTTTTTTQDGAEERVLRDRPALKRERESDLPRTPREERGSATFRGHRLEERQGTRREKCEVSTVWFR